MPEVRFVDTGEVRLRCVDFGGSGPAMLVLHGLCGTADEWVDFAARLTVRAHVISFDQRGHGQSTRRPDDLSQGAFVRDAESVIASFHLNDVIIVGQSMGGRTAMLLAAEHSATVRGLVIIEASPSKNPDAPQNLAALLAKWPASFGSRAEAEDFFAGPGVTAASYAANLAEKDGKLLPQFDIDIMLDTVRDASDSDYWDQWTGTQVPALIIAGEKGMIPRTDYARMLARNEIATFEEVAGAGHDVHLERPEEIQILLATFLDAIKT